MVSPEDSAPLPALPVRNQVDWFPPRDEFDREVKRRLEGYLSPDQLRDTIGGVEVDLSGGNVTLSSAPARVRLTGATAARALTLPASFGSVFVDNDTAYTITLARTGSASTLAVLAGATVQIAGV